MRRDPGQKPLEVSSQLWRNEKPRGSSKPKLPTLSGIYADRNSNPKVVLPTDLPADPLRSSVSSGGCPPAASGNVGHPHGPVNLQAMFGFAICHLFSRSALRVLNVENPRRVIPMS